MKSKIPLKVSNFTIGRDVRIFISYLIAEKVKNENFVILFAFLSIPRKYNPD